MVLFLFSRWNDFLISKLLAKFLWFFWGAPVRLCVLCSLFGLMGFSLGVCNACALHILE